MSYRVACVVHRESLNCLCIIYSLFTEYSDFIKLQSYKKKNLVVLLKNMLL